MEKQQEFERVLQASQDANAKYAEQVAREGGPAKDDATHQRKSRARASLKVALVAAAAAILGLLVIQSALEPSTEDEGDVVADVPTARKLREDALTDCANAQWALCLIDLGSARDLDPTGDNDPSVQSLWQQGVQGARRDGLTACEHEQWSRCATELDLASHYDPDGDREPGVMLARRRAVDALEVKEQAPPDLKSAPH